jgi:DNA-binding response OmpR family regulator
VGASDYLPKPIDPERLLGMLNSRLNGAPPQPAESSPAPAGGNERRDAT